MYSHTDKYCRVVTVTPGAYISMLLNYFHSSIIMSIISINMTLSLFL
jgi:hypothetical protein